MIKPTSDRPENNIFLFNVFFIIGYKKIIHIWVLSRKHTYNCRAKIIYVYIYVKRKKCLRKAKVNDLSARQACTGTNTTIWGDYHKLFYTHPSETCARFSLSLVSFAHACPSFRAHWKWTSMHELYNVPTTYIYTHMGH